MESNTLKSPNKELGNLIVSYGNVYFVEGFDPVQVTDEERIFYELLTKTYKDQGSEINSFRNYILKLITSIRSGFYNSVIQRFENASLNMQSKHSKLLSSIWKKLEEKLNKISMQLIYMNFTDIVMIGLSLLFMLRTSKRCLFIYLHNINKQSSKNDMYTALYDVLSYINTFLNNFEEEIDVHALMLPAYNVTEKLVNILDILMKSSLNDRITTKLNKCKPILEIPKVANMINLLLRLNINDDLTNPIPTVNVKAKVNATIKSAKFEPEKYDDINKFYIACKYVMMLQHQKNEDLAKIAEHLEPLYIDSDVYQYLVELNEILTGSVRVIVKVRRIHTDKMNGGSKNNKLFFKNLYTYLKHIAYANSKNRKVFYKLQGGNSILNKIDNYQIELNRKFQQVIFNGISDEIHKMLFSKYDKLNIRESYSPYSYIFGPFYAVCDSNEDMNEIIQKTLNINNIIKKFHDSPDPQTIVFYTYGYSGSGKTYTLFGETNNSTKIDVKNGILWKILNELQQEGFKVELVESAKCYGTLESSQTIDKPEKSQYYFLNNSKKETHNYTQDKEWLKVINDIKKIEKNPDTGLTLPSSFIKSTPNNYQSSRGFFILKFKVENKNKVHYIGVIDMAGNEDPVDIQSMMLPSLGYEFTPDLLKNTDKIFTNDIIYGQLIKKLQNVFFYVLAFIIEKQKQGIIRQTNFTNALPDINSLKEIKNTLATIDENIVKIKKDIRSKKKINSEKERDELNKLYNQLKHFKIENLIELNYVSLETTTKNPDTGFQWELTFTINKDLLNEIVNLSLETLINEVQDEKELNELKHIEPTLAIVKEEIIRVQAQKEFTKNKRLSIVMLKYISKNIESIQLKNNVFKMILKLKEQSASFNDYIKDETGKKEFNEKIKKSLISFFKNQPYIFTPITTKDEKQYLYGLDTIATIIQEGYFINQANAELIHYFKQKQSGEILKPQKVTTNKYTFEDKFTLSKYNKFERVNDTFYETDLVPTLYDMFGGDSLDIMFACLRDDKDIRKVKGAIDTLYLVRDIKST